MKTNSATPRAVGRETAAERRAYFGPPIVKWGRSKEGYSKSKDGRFNIHPLYCGTTSAQMYELLDNRTGKRLTADTQFHLKLEADRIVKLETALRNARAEG